VQLSGENRVRKEAPEKERKENNGDGQRKGKEGEKGKASLMPEWMTNGLNRSAFLIEFGSA